VLTSSGWVLVLVVDLDAAAVLGGDGHVDIAGQEALRRMYARTEDRDTPTTWATREAQYDAVCTWGIPDHAKLQRLGCLEMPVFVANGDSHPMVLPHYSHLLAGLIPQARVKIYPDSAHGFLFQHYADLPLTSGPSLATLVNRKCSSAFLAAVVVTVSSDFPMLDGFSG